MPPIVTLTLNPAIDAACQADEVRPIRKIRTSNERYEPGGGGINVARVIKELGGEALAVYCAGGLIGQALGEMVAAAGLDRRAIQIAGLTRVSHTVFERSTGKEYRFVPEGPALSEPSGGRASRSSRGRLPTTWSRAAACRAACPPTSTPGSPAALARAAPASCSTPRASRCAGRSRLAAT